MRIEWKEGKRKSNLAKHGLDFSDASKVFYGPEFTLLDDRFEYPEPRFQTYGQLNERLVMIAWTPIPDGKHVISMRKCNDREKGKFASKLG